jgi:heme exporter protein D
MFSFQDQANNFIILLIHRIIQFIILFLLLASSSWSKYVWVYQKTSLLFMIALIVVTLSIHSTVDIDQFYTIDQRLSYEFLDANAIELTLLEIGITLLK